MQSCNQMHQEAELDKAYDSALNLYTKWAEQDYENSEQHNFELTLAMRKYADLSGENYFSIAAELHELHLQLKAIRANK